MVVRSWVFCWFVYPRLGVVEVSNLAMPVGRNGRKKKKGKKSMLCLVKGKGSLPRQELLGNNRSIQTPQKKDCSCTSAPTAVVSEKAEWEFNIFTEVRTFIREWWRISPLPPPVVTEATWRGLSSTLTWQYGGTFYTVVMSEEAYWRVRPFTTTYH